MLVTHVIEELAEASQGTVLVHGKWVPRGGKVTVGLNLSIPDQIRLVNVMKKFRIERVRVRRQYAV